VSSGPGGRPPATPPRWLAPAIVVGILVLDQLTKSWVVATRSETALSIIGDDVQINLTRNSGGAFSLFTNATVVLAILAIGLSVFLVRAVQKARDWLTVIALSMVLGGALGNLTDRIVRSPGFLRGHVVDFVQVGTFPTFNVADSAITIGAILLVIAAFRESSRTPDEHPV
jgi:signal peptidase II